MALGVRAWTDSSAAIGTTKRQGFGKLRHLECQSLWIQQRLRRGEFTLHKVNGNCNPGDLLTKHLESQRKLDELVALFRCRLVEGRSAIAPALKRDNQGAVQLVNEDGEERELAEAHDMHVLPH